MAGRLSGRVKRLEDKMLVNKPGLLIVIVDYGETDAEAIARVKKENPDFDEEQDHIFLMNFANAQLYGTDEQKKD